MLPTQPSSIDRARPSGSAGADRAPNVTRRASSSFAIRIAECTKVALIVNEKGSSGWRPIARGGEGRRRANARTARIPATVQRKIEQGARYQELLARLVELSAQLQATLTHEQRALWLRLEDVLFDYAQVMAEAHYIAGRKHSERDQHGARNEDDAGMRESSE